MLKTRLLSTLLALACALPAPPLGAQVSLPALGDAASEDLDLGAEKRLGEQIMREVRRDPAYLDDPVLLDYAQSLWSPLVAAGRRLGHIDADTRDLFAWELFLVRDRSVNAFALPGGHVGVHLGLIAMTGSSAELASVLAHELSHVTQRHIARSIGGTQRNTVVGTAAMILALVLASRAGNADMANAAIAGGQAALLQGQLNFSRDAEREADRIGFALLQGAGHDGRGMAAMFDKLAHANRINDSGAFPYLRSHPLTTERVADARSRAPQAGSGAPPASALHAMMSARAQVLMDPAAHELRRWQGARAAPDAGLAERLGALYAVALSSALLREPQAAREALARARATLARADAGAEAEAVRQLHLLAAELALAADDVAQAQTALSALSALPAATPAPAPAAPATRRPELLLRAQAALAAARQGQGDAAAQVRASTEALQTWTTDHAADALAWTMLAQCAEAAGLPLRAARAQAEARASAGDRNGAIDVLRAAQRRARSAEPAELIEAQVIDARLRALLAQARQEREGARGEPRQAAPGGAAIS